MHPQNCSIMENFLFQLPNFYVPRSISSFIEQHGTNMTAGDEVLKKLWSTEGGAQLWLKSTISHVGEKVDVYNFSRINFTSVNFSSLSDPVACFGSITRTTMVITAVQTMAFFENPDQMGIPHATVVQLQVEGITVIQDLADFDKDTLQQLAGMTSANKSQPILHSILRQVRKK